MLQYPLATAALRGGLTLERAFARQRKGIAAPQSLPRRWSIRLLSASLTEARPVYNKPVDIIDLCSRNSTALLTPVAVDDLIARARNRNRPPEPPAHVHKLTSRLGVEACDLICERYEAGGSASSLARQYGVSRNAILNLVRARNIVVRGRAISNEQLQRMVELYESGQPIAAIQISVGASYGAVRRALLGAGTRMRPRGFQPKN